jgi:hypothetical protein
MRKNPGKVFHIRWRSRQLFNIRPNKFVTEFTEQSG